MNGPVRLSIDRARLVRWNGEPWVFWPSGQRGRYTFAGLVRVIRYWVGAGRSFEIVLTPSAPRTSKRDRPGGSAGGA